MKRGVTGRYLVKNVDGELVRAFVPFALPPDPPLEFSRERLGRQAANVLRVFDVLRLQPLATVSLLAERAGISFVTAARAVDALEHLGIVREITGRQRHRVFAYAAYLAILNEGTEPL